MANECIPAYRPGTDLTVIAGAGGVDGKTFVDISAALDPAGGTPATAVTATAGGLSIGVAVADAPADAKVAVIRGRGTVLPVVAGGVIALGAEVEVGADGKAVTLTTGKARGRAWTAGVANGDVFIELY